MIGIPIKEVRLKAKRKTKKKKEEKGCDECKKPFNKLFKGQKTCGKCLDGYL